MIFFLRTESNPEDADAGATVLMLDGKLETSRARLRNRMNRTLGPERMRRVIFLASLDGESYYRLLSICDVVLDSPVYAGDQTGARNSRPTSDSI